MITHGFFARVKKTRVSFPRRVIENIRSFKLVNDDDLSAFAHFAINVIDHIVRGADTAV